MDDFLTNDPAVLIINELDYDNTRRWCQTNHQFRQKCNLNYWLNQIMIEFNLTPEQVNDLLIHKPVNVTMAVYYKWLKMWFYEMSTDNLEKVVEQGLLPVIKLYHYNGINLDYTDFMRAVTNGHLKVAQWIYNLGDINIHAHNEHAFRRAVALGHLDVTKWLYSLGDVDIHAVNDVAFRGAVVYGHLDVAKWLYSLGGVDIHVNNDEAFRMATERGHLAVAQWLNSL